MLLIVEDGKGGGDLLKHRHIYLFFGGGRTTNIM
jgi:hypothetical protein